MIVCTMPFFNELDLLEIKLHTMAPAVDMFVVCESTRSYMGAVKPLHFDENKDRFNGFPIKHVIVDDSPMDTDAWGREGYQHDKMAEAVFALNPNSVIWTDTDEIAKPEAIRSFIESKYHVAALEMDWLRFFANREHNKRWAQRVIARDGVHHVSSVPGMPLILDAGWHFNYVRDKQSLLDTINSTSHATEPGTPGFYNAVRQDKHPQIELTTPYDEARLPKYLTDNRERFKHLFLPEGAPLT